MLLRKHEKACKSQSAPKPPPAYKATTDYPVEISSPPECCGETADTVSRGPTAHTTQPTVAVTEVCDQDGTDLMVELQQLKARLLAAGHLEKAAQVEVEIQLAAKQGSEPGLGESDALKTRQSAADGIVPEVHAVAQEAAQQHLASKAAPSSSVCRFCGTECGAPMLLRKHERACGAQ